MESLNILLISTACAVSKPNMTYGGVELVVRDVANTLNKRGHMVTVAAPFGSEFDEGVHLFPTVRLPAEVWNENIIFQRLTRQKLVPDGFDIMHDFSHQHLTGRITHGSWALPHPFMFMLWHTPVFRGMPNRIPEPVYNLCGVGKWQSEELSKIYNQEVKYSYLGTDTEKIQLQKKKGNRYLWLATPNKEKGGIEAVEICRELGLMLDCVGGQIAGSSSDYARRMQMMCDGKDIKWIGGVDENRKIRMLQEAKALIFPAQQEEAFNLVAIEGMAAGTPMFTLDVGGLTEIFHGEDDTYGYTAENLDDLKSALNEFETDSKVWWEPEDLRGRVVSKFSNETMVDGYLELYKLILAEEFWY